MESSVRKQWLVLMVVMSVVSLVVIFGCAPKSDTESTQDMQETEESATAVIVEWSPESECAICHTTEEASYSITDCMAGVHTSQDMKCADCHNNIEGLTEAHKNVSSDSTPATRLKRTTVSNDTCTAAGCHDDPQVRIDATASVTYVADSTGRVVNPHDLPENEQHDKVLCVGCHKGHQAVGEEEYIDTCYECHHTKEFACGTCHE